MNRTQNRLLLFVLSFFLINVAFSQTLYWIGGSGSFNDPKHWALSSGGKPAFQIPDIKTDVVFDDFSAIGYYSVNFNNNSSARNIKANASKNILKFTGINSSVVYVSEGISLSPLVKFESQAEMIFNSNSDKSNVIQFGLNKLNCNLYFNNGLYEFKPISLNNQKTINFKDGTYNFNNSFVEAGNFLNSGSAAKFYFNDAYVLIHNSFKVSESADFISNNLYAQVNKNAQEKFNAPENMISERTNTIVNNTMAPCTVTITTSPACTGTCTGVLTINFDANCTNTPYNITVTNGTCPGEAAALSAANVTTSVYTNSTACACALLNYLVVVRDFSNVIVGSAFVNFIPNPIINTVTKTQPTCSYLCDGSMTGNIFTGPAFTVAVTPATATPVFTTSADYTLTSLCAGNYTFTITDEFGCVAIDTQTLNGPAPISPNAVTNTITCNGSCNGSFKVSPTGGVAGYTVQFNTGPTFTVPAAGSASIGGLCPALYTATITDVNGCSVTVNANITQPTPIVIVPTQTNLTCFSICNGAASVAVSGGTSPYVYVWSPGPSNSNSITGLCAETQTVSFFDANGCPGVQTFSISSPPAITLTLAQKDITCNSLCNGAATVQAAGGTGAITFTWTGPAFGPVTTSVISGLCPGVYTLTAKDAVNCPATETINITEPSASTVTALVTDNTCFSNCAGSATISIAGGNGAPYGYTWTPGVTIPQGQGTATLSSLCAGSYTLASTDASACPISTVITITQPTSITPNVSTTSVTCNAGCDGSINSAPAGGGGGPYTFTLETPFATTLVTNPPYNNLCAGIYTLSIKDASSCVTSTLITVTQPNPLNPSIASVSVSCFNACDGVLAGSVLGGTPGYTLMWNTPTGTVAGGNIAGQCAGNYTFNVTDANSCTVALTFTLNQPADITATLNPTSPSCNTFCDGSILANIVGGTPGYTLNWSSGSGNPNNGRCAGNYTLLVQDSKGCTKQFTTAIVAPPAFTVAVNTTSTSCAGTCDGSATVTALGGTGLITYQFNTIPVTINTTGIVSGLCAGAYIVSITDANGCSTSQAFNISSPPLLTAAITGIVPTCNVCTGAATVTVGGGTPTYTINWTNSASATVAVGTTASNLCLGSYTANVVDANGCIATAVANIPNTVSVTIITGGSPILCFGACNASATANAIGGTPAYNYTWSSVPVQNTQNATNLCAGDYTVTVVDQLGCSNTASITIAQPSSVTVSSSQTNVPCFAGCNGIITTTVSGGTPAYNYSWSPGGQTTTSLTSLCAGDYTLNVKDLNNCSQTFTYSIIENPSITAVFTATNPSGCIINDGIIEAVASGGSGAGYTFTWSPATASVVNGATTTATGLGAGSYSLFIMDGAGCTASLSTNLSNPAGPTLNVTSASVTCFGANNGSAVATAIGVGPFSFTWSPATASVFASPSTTATGLGAGNYNINVTDIPTGCITSQTINITAPTAMTITSNVTNATCNGANNGSITATVAGGTPNYTLNWLPAGTGTAITNLTPGNYTVNVTDANSCISTKTFVVTEPGSLTVTATQTNVTCSTFSNGAISVTVTGGTPAYNYSWTAVGSFTGSTNSSVSNLPPNVYTVTITDFFNCPIVQTFTITEPAVIGHTINTINLACNATCIGTASQVVTGGTPTYSFSWSSTAATTQSIGSLCAGNYTGTVIDANGCTSSLPFVITQPAVISITATPTQPLCNGSTNGSITAVVSGGTPTYTLNWLPAGTGTAITNLGAGNYTVTVTDASLCVGNAVITLTNPPSVLANVSFTNPLCSSGCDGVAVSNPINATAPINYTWTSVPTQTTQTASALCAGVYSVFVSDFNGCTDVQQVTLSSPPALTITPSTFPATCGSSNGTITISTSGGTPTYAILWTPSAATTSFINNVPAGIYTVAVTDFNGCTNTVSIPLSNANGPNGATILTTSVNCNSQCTGGATITAGAGGTLPYVFSWVSPPAPSTVNPQSNLCAGNYTAQVEDANNCLYFQGISILEPTAIDDNEAVTDALCIGVCSGSVLLAPSGGTGPYTYLWSPSPSTTTSATSLCVGVHTATITDNLGCLFTATYNVAGTTIITSTLVNTPNICFGDCLGSATVAATAGGSIPYSYVWSNFQSGIATNNLCNGTYSVNVTDNNGCQNTFTTDIISPNAITLNTSISSPSCGMCNGSSTISALGGTPSYSYTWSSGGTTTVEGNLCAGLYQVLVTDVNGCSQVQNIPISNSSGITGETFVVQDEACFNDCNGSVSVTPIGGTPSYSYSWINPVSTNSFITNLCGGTYFVQMTDAQGCIRTSSISVSSATDIIITPSVTPPTCTSNNGTISVNVTGGTGIYTYAWLPGGGSTATLNTIGAGIYTLTVNDGVCTKTIAINLNNATSPLILSTITDNGCAGDPCSGSVVITPTLGTPGYNVSWSNGNVTNTVSGLCQGVITVTVTDALGCAAVQSFSISENPAINLSLPFVTQVKCNNDCDGSINVIPNGGTIPYVYSWIPATTVTPTNPLTNLCTGTYTSIITDSKGCSITSTIDLVNPLPFSLTALITDATCNSSADGAATTTVNGATPGYTYTWSGPASYTTQSISNVAPGTYSLSIMDSNGCLKDTTMVIGSTFTVLADAGTDYTLCTNGSIILDGSNSINAATYSWSLAPVAGTLANTATTSVIPPIGTNTYVLFVTSTIAACFDDDSVVVNVNPLPNVDAGPSQSISLLSSTSIGGNPTSATALSYTWSPSGTLNDSHVPNPVASNSVNTIYTIMVTDANGCINTSTVEISIYPQISIPNGFSPNSDGRNDKWIIDNIQQFPDCVVEVYNRWGELLFHSKGYGTPFDGRYNGKDLPVGTYYYVIEMNHPAYTKPYTGPLTIFR